MAVSWNLWHGCHKLSEGCKFCYVYRGDAKRDVDSSICHKTNRFDVPTERKKNGEYKVKGGQLVWTCFTSDFLLSDADEWRIEAWKMIRERQDLTFLFITKRIDRFLVNLPDDWGEGYDNVVVCCTCENQERADYRLPIFKDLKIKHKVIICEPLLTPIDLSKYLNDSIEQVVVGGESGYNVRECDYDWVLDIRRQCQSKNVTFHFKQTGTYFKKDGRVYFVQRSEQHKQAAKANIYFSGKHSGYISNQIGDNVSSK